MVVCGPRIWVWGQELEKNSNENDAQSAFQFIYSGIKYSNIYYHIIVLPFVVKVVSKLTTHKDKNYFVIDNNLLSDICSSAKEVICLNLGFSSYPLNVFHCSGDSH